MAGHTQLDWSQQWWQWLAGFSNASSPLFDSTGSLANRNNDGPVFFLAGAPPGAPAVRSMNVPPGKLIFFPVLNVADSETGPGSCFDASPENPLACALNVINGFIGNARNLSVVIDGVTVLNDANKGPFRQTSNSFFDLNPTTDDNIFGVPAGNYPGSAVSDGYWMALDGLSAGTHISLSAARSTMVPPPASVFQSPILFTCPSPLASG